jgi:putative transposase
MPSTHLSLHFHVIFSTKQRTPWIEDGFRDRVHAYMGGTLRGLKAIPECIGGTYDHVHLLVALPATVCISDIVRDLKRATTNWMHHETNHKAFAWQEGYAAFSVSADHRASLGEYIANQDEHHRRVSVLDELRRLLVEHGVEYDERYLE